MRLIRLQHISSQVILTIRIAARVRGRCNCKEQTGPNGPRLHEAAAENTPRKAMGRSFHVRQRGAICVLFTPNSLVWRLAWKRFRAGMGAFMVPGNFCRQACRPVKVIQLSKLTGRKRPISFPHRRVPRHREAKRVGRMGSRESVAPTRHPLVGLKPKADAMPEVGKQTAVVLIRPAAAR